jgi:hypothetical protein
MLIKEDRAARLKGGRVDPMSHEETPLGHDWIAEEPPYGPTMTEIRTPAQRLLDWLFEQLERAQERDRSHNIDSATNAREVSQRIHRLEQPSSALQAN